MKLSEVFDQLAAGELRQAGVVEDGAVKATASKQLGLLVTAGLTELHKRFTLRKTRVVVTLQDSMTVYRMYPEAATSSTDAVPAVKYIDDSKQLLDTEVWNIDRLYDAEGEELAINEIDNPKSFLTSGMDTIVVTSDYEFDTFDAVLRLGHPAINQVMLEAYPAGIEINLPGTHLYALTLYVASRYFSAKGMTNEFHEGNSYLAKFEAECQRLQAINAEIQENHESAKFDSNGWA